MGKSKKTIDKVIQYYRGVTCKPAKAVDENEQRIIIKALKSDRSAKNFIYKTTWLKRPVTLKIVYGLSASLRCLKQKKTKALIYDDTAGPHLAKYFDEFTAKANCSVIKAHRLIETAKELGLTTLLTISIVETVVSPDNKAIESEDFNQLCKLLQAKLPDNLKTEVVFEVPVIERIRSTGSSKAKKLERTKVKPPKLSKTTVK